MAGEYYEWLARDVKPEEKRELTPAEKRKNWWHYHKWHVLLAAVLLFCLIDIIAGVVETQKAEPDYSIAYIGSASLPEDTVESLEKALAELGEDLNGNGTVGVEIHQYLIYADENSDDTSMTKEDNMSYAYAGQIQLAADFESCDSFFFLMEDPERFQKDYQILSRLNGSLPEETPDSQVPLYISWTQCPALTSLPLGDYTEENLGVSVTGSSQDLLSGLYIARRGFWQENTCDNAEGCADLWNKLLEGVSQ